MKIALIIVAILILLLTQSKMKNIKNLMKFRKGYIGKSDIEITNGLKRTELIVDEIEKGNTKFLLVSSITRRTLKVFKFKNQVCINYLLVSSDLTEILNGYDYKDFIKKFSVIEDEHFDFGIQLSAFVNTDEKILFDNFLSIEVSKNIFAKIFLSEDPKTVKHRPLHVYCFGNSIKEIDTFIEEINTQFYDFIKSLNSDKLKVGSIFDDKRWNQAR